MARIDYVNNDAIHVIKKEGLVHYIENNEG